MTFLTITVNYSLNSDLKCEFKKTYHHDQTRALELHKENMWILVFVLSNWGNKTLENIFHFEESQYTIMN